MLDLFQSLSGFQVRCNALENVTGQVVGYQFQSLSGFQVRCNGLALELIALDSSVSIPIGFSSSLQQPCLLAADQALATVSIPIGFSSSLQPADWYSSYDPEERFQSLSGFQVRCNSMSRSVYWHIISSFNPYRVFKFVATLDSRMYPADSRVFQSLSGFQVRCNARAHEGRARKAQVSIPIGFSSSLQLFLRWLTISQRKSFNPYRVFKFVATQSGILPRDLALWVSIPIGFSSSLQHRHSAESRLDYQGFNPYRVFKFVATYPPPVPPICWT